MAQRDALQTVLDLRRHKQDMEERRLASILRDRTTCQEELELVAAELQQVTSMRLRQMEHIQNGLSHQECDTAVRRLGQKRAEVLTRMRELENQRLQQMLIYVAARCDRELIEGVHRKREELREADGRAREQRRVEELFLARRVLRSDTSAGEMR